MNEVTDAAHVHPLTADNQRGIKGFVVILGAGSQCISFREASKRWRGRHHPSVPGRSFRLKLGESRHRASGIRKEDFIKRRTSSTCLAGAPTMITHQSCKYQKPTTMVFAGP